MDAVEFPSHRHPLKPIESLPREEDEDEDKDKDEEEEDSRVCGLCGEAVKGSGYECSQCDFPAHLGCLENPPPLTIFQYKRHEHPLILLPRKVSFTCNACGLSGDKSPYVCLLCSFMVHKDCINFPRVIRTTRHVHRLSLTFFLGPGNWSCRVCRQSMDGQYGGYSCARCVDYVVHSRCATKEEVWDGVELEGVPENKDDHDEVGSEPSQENMLIRHLSHQQHILRLENVQDVRDDVVCSGCALSIASESFYRCDDLCDFYLHQQCANLPLKKKTFLHVHKLTLCTEERSGLSRCDACKLHFNGFTYRCLECNDGKEFDIRCCSVSDPFWISDHNHPLDVTVPTDEIGKANICSSCGLEELKLMLTCKHCSLRLCMTCATLPTNAVYKYDEHLLWVNTGYEPVTSLYLCDICEKKIEEKGSFYACFRCDPVLHTKCALGSFRHMRPGLSFTTDDGGGHTYQVVLNDRTLQVRCSQCLKYCHEPLFLMSTTSGDAAIYLCSSRCFETYDSI